MAAQRRPQRGSGPDRGGRGGGGRGPSGGGGRSHGGGGRGHGGGGGRPRGGGGGEGSDKASPIKIEKRPDDLPTTEFEQFALADSILDAIAAAGYEKPTEVQEQVIPLALNEKNVVARSRTGTGKTCAFLTPLISLLDEVDDDEFIAAGQPKGPVRILVVVPTRELAIQVAGEAERLTRYLPIRTTCVYGGTRINKQINELKDTAIAVGTPGRILDHISRRTMDLSNLESIVLDEVDRMYDLGFRDDVDRILAAARARSQTILMSATLNNDVERLIAKHVPEHERVLIESKSLTVDEVDQSFYFVDPRRKQDLLVQLIEEHKPECGIVFVRTRFSTDRLAHRLREMGYDCNEIHSGLPQRKREQILSRFREGKFPLLIATDVAARGLDIDGITHVFNYDIPTVAEDYVHRIGRTARMGRRGVGISLIGPDDGRILTEIEMLINKEIEQLTYPGFELKRVERVTKKPEPPKNPGLRGWKNVRRRR